MSKKLKRVCVCGHFGNGANLLNGQTVKTKILADELVRQYGEDDVCTIDTHGGIKALLRLPFQIFSALRKCENIVMLPAHRGVRVITPILTIENALFHRNLHYAIIGAWLPKMLENKKGLLKHLQKFDALYAETTTLKNSLEKLGLDNVAIMPNCKPLVPLDSKELNFDWTEPYRLCTFSRVMQEKGIEDAVEAVKRVNKEYNRVVFSLDIYGQVDEKQTEWFNNLKKTFPDYVMYKGMVDFDKSVNTLKDYFALLFPTRFYTEGVPGTIIDAYAAGVPVISAKWESFADVIDEGITGYGYEICNFNELVALLKKIEKNSDCILEMKRDCHEKAREFIPKTAIVPLLLRME